MRFKPGGGEGGAPARPGLLDRLARGPVRRPRLTLALAAVVVALAGLAASQMRAAGSLAVMFPRDQPSARALVGITERFAAGDELIALIEAPPAMGPEAAARMTAFARRFQRELRGQPRTSAMVRAVAYRPPPVLRTFAREVAAPSLAYYLDEAAFERFRARLSGGSIERGVERAEALAAAPGGAGELGKRIARDPLRLYQFVLEYAMPGAGAFSGGATRGGGEGERAYLSPDGRALLVRIRPREPASEMAFVRELMPAVRAAARRAEPGALRVAFTGSYAIADAAQRSVRSDMVRSITGSIVLLALLFLATYRGRWGLWAFPLAFAPVGAGVLLGFAAGWAAGLPITPPTAVLGAILAGLGIDYAIHYLAHYHGGAEGGAMPEARVSRKIGPSLAAACMTSVLAFVAIAFSDIPALRGFAVIGAVGLAAALLGVLTLLPAMLALIRGRGAGRPRTTGPHARGDRPPEAEGRKSALRWSVEPLLRGLIARRRWSIGGVCGVLALALLVLAASPGGPLRFETDMSVMHPQPNAPLAAQRRITRRFDAAPQSLLIHLRARTPRRLLTLSHAVRQRLERSPDAGRYVAGTLGPASVLPDPSKAARRAGRMRTIDAERVLGDLDAALAGSIFDPAAFEDYRGLLGRMLRPGPPPGVEDLLRYESIARPMFPRTAFTRGAAPREAVVRVVMSEPLIRVARLDRAVAALRGALGGLDGATLTGLDAVAADARRAVRADLAGFLSLAVGLVVVWLLAFFRRAGEAALALSPAVFGIVAALAAMRLAGFDWNPVNLIALPLLAGLGVDDGIFLVSVMRATNAKMTPSRSRRPSTPLDGERAGAGGASRPLHRREELAASAHAVTMTSATTVLAFGSLLGTSVPAIRSLGFVLAVGVAACWLASMAGLAPWLAGEADEPERAG